MIKFPALFALSLVAALVVVRPVLELLRVAGATRANFRGRTLPAAGGMVLVAAFVLVFGTASVAPGFFPVGKSAAGLFLLAVLGFGLLGLVDDLLGNRDVGGFRGHFSRLLKGELTTGALKALGGGLIALYLASSFSRGFGELVLNSLLIVVFANTINLFDLRPGRAIKVFLLLSAVVFAASAARSPWVIWAAILPPVGVLFYTDLREKCMIGDIGSNVLGAVIGLTSALVLATGPKLVAAALLLFVQIVTERYSITEGIERSAALRWFDRLGRGGT